MKNIFYFYNINKIGGIETWFYQISKKYKDWDITIYYQVGDLEQIKRLKKYVRVIKYNGQKIECERAFFCFNTDIYNNVKAKEKIKVYHGDYKDMVKRGQVEKNNDPHEYDFDKYIGVSELVCKSAEEVYGHKKVELCYNPYTIEKPKKVLNLISATRLTSEKGKKRMIKLSKMLDEAGIPYLWTIFTNDTQAIENPNIIYMKPRLDIINYIANADYLVQLSDNEGYCYSVVEALSVGTPVIVTDIPVLKEIGVVNKNNGFIIDLEMKNVPIKEIYKGLPKFKYEPKKDNWDKLLAKGKSTYQKDLKTMVLVKCISDYFDIELKQLKTKDSKPYKVNKIRTEELIGYGDIEIVKEGENNG